MVARTVVHLECDPCTTDGVQEDAITVNVAGLELEVCNKHGQQVELVAQWLKAYGRPAGTAPSSTRKPKTVTKKADSAKTTTRQPRKKAEAVPEVSPTPARTAARFTCGDCGDELAGGSKTGHARDKHGKSARRVTWTKVE